MLENVTSPVLSVSLCAQRDLCSTWRMAEEWVYAFPTAAVVNSYAVIFNDYFGTVA